MHDDARRAHGRAAVAGDREAALLVPLLALLLHELGVDELDELLRVLPARQVDHDHAQRHADLGRREPDAGRRVHGLDHVVRPARGSRRRCSATGADGSCSTGSPYFTMGRRAMAGNSHKDRGTQRTGTLRRRCSAGAAREELAPARARRLEVVEQLRRASRRRTSRGARPRAPAPPSPRPRRRRPARRRCRCARRRPSAASFVRRSIERSGMTQGRDRLHDRPGAELLAVRDAALEAAGAVGRPVRGRARRRRGSRRGKREPRRLAGREPVADRDRLDGGDRHERLGEPAVEPAVPLRERPEARRHAARDHLERRRPACRRPSWRGRSPRSSRSAAPRARSAPGSASTAARSSQRDDVAAARAASPMRSTWLRSSTPTVAQQRPRERRPRPRATSSRARSRARARCAGRRCRT